MNIPRVVGFLSRHGYTLCSPLPAAVEAIPEEPGVYVVVIGHGARPRAIATRPVSEPGLRTDIRVHLADPAIAIEAPNIIAFRVVERWPGEPAEGHHARLVAEQAAIARSLAAQV